jgi:YD repeat-containing protein
VEYTYNTKGNLMQRQNPDGLTTDYRCDSHSRLIEEHKRTSSGTSISHHKFAYDITGAMTEFDEVFGVKYGTKLGNSGGGSGIKYANPQTIGQAEGVKFGRYGKFGQIKYGKRSWTKYGEMVYGELDEITPGQSYISGRIKYGLAQKKSEYDYDALSRLTEYTDYFGDIYHYGYDMYNRLVLVRYPNNTLTTYEFYDNGKLRTISHLRVEKSASRTLLESFTYEYDENSNITKITNSDKYGDTGNICSKTETRPGTSPQTTTYTYDSYNGSS